MFFTPPAILGSPAVFDTSFPANENPLSQGGIWLNGLADGVDWENASVTSATDGIQRAVTPNLTTGFADSTAILSPSYRTFHNDQFVECVVYLQSGYVPTGTYHESEMRLRSSLSAHSCTGYEILFAYNDHGVSNDGYAVVRWNGALGDFTTIFNGGGGSTANIVDGDVFRAEIAGNFIKVYQNSNLLGTHDITSIAGTVYTSGQPGIGFFTNPGCTANAYGWRRFKAGDLS